MTIAAMKRHSRMRKAPAASTKTLNGNGRGWPRGEQQRPEVVPIDQVLATRALLGAEFPEGGLSAFARDEVEEERADGRTGDGGDDVDRRHCVIVMRERHHCHVRASR